MFVKILICICIFLSSMTHIYANEDILAKNAKASILIEHTTHKVLNAHNEQEKLYPASTTKIMTMILLFEAINNKTLQWDDILTCSEYASSMGGSQVYLETGEQMSVYDLFKAICISSANDASVVISERIGGSHEAFVEMMNNKAKELNLINTQFKNATGLHDDNHYTCAYDLAIMASYLIEIGKDKLLEVTSLYDSYIREGNKKFWLVNTNKLLNHYQGVDGLKTGYTKEAGYCMVVTAKRNGLRLIGVVLKENDPKVRNQELIKMLDYGFSLFERKILFKKDEVIEVKNIEHARNNIEVICNEDISYIKKKDENMEVKYKIEYNHLLLPLNKGDIIGKIILFNNGKIINQYDLRVKEDISKLSLLEIIYSYIKLLI